MASALAFALRRLRRGLAAGELRVLVASIAIAAAAAVAVGLFTDRVRRAVEDGAGEQFGADAAITGREPLPAALAARAAAFGLATSTVTQFPSVVARTDGEQTQLATIKAVGAGYPLRGRLALAREPFGAAGPAHGPPPRGEAWVDPKLWSALALDADASLAVGTLTLKATRFIAEEPGRGGAFAELAPTLLMNADDLPASGLLGPGSRIQSTLQLAGPRAALAQARALPLPAGFRWRTPADEGREVQRSLDRSRAFLDIAVLATLLLAAAAAALAARQHAARLRDEVALLKVLGARRAFVRRALAAQILLPGLAAGLLGALLGYGAQAVLAALAGPALGLTLPAPGWLPVPAALALVAVMLAGFALPPVLAAVEAAPVRVFQRMADAAGTRGGTLAAALALAALLALTARDWTLAAYVAGGAAATALVLGLLGALLVFALGTMRKGVGVSWRFGLGNLARRRGATVAQIIALGVSALALLLVTVVREDLLAAWRDRVPADAPNQFLINIQPEQRAPLLAFFAAHGYAAPELAPMTRARLIALNGRPITAASFDDPETRRWVNREFNLSWTDHFRDDSRFIAGQPWGPEARGQPWLSADQYAVERLKLKLGDTLTLDFAGHPLSLTIRSIRDIRWESFRPNFFLVAPPGVLDAPALGAPLQWITSFHLPDTDRALLRELLRAFPNVTALDLDAALAQARTTIQRVVAALEFIFLFALLAGLVVMLAVIEGSRPERVREVGVLRALGAPGRIIVRALIAEYAALGALSGGVAALVAQVLASVLARRVFELPLGPEPWLWISGTLGGALVVAGAGYLSLRGVLNTSPRAVLAATA